MATTSKTPKTPKTKPPRAARTRAKDQDTGRKAAVRAKYAETTTMAAAAMVPVDKPLTTQQRLFVQHWAKGETIPNAMARAGYNDQPSYGYRMAKMPNILALYNEEKAKYEEAAQMTRQRVMDGLLEAVEMAKLMAEPATMVSGWREIGKMCGYFEPKKVDINVNVTGNVIHQRLNQLSDAELLKIIQEQGAEPLLDAPEYPLEGDDDEN
jgi:phage terminase small subunit